MTWTLACPSCRAALGTTDDGSTHRACGCGVAYDRVDGVWRFLPASAGARYERFLAEYTAIRRAEGRGSDDPAHYRALPSVPTGDALADQWRMRATSWAAVRSSVLDGGGSRRVLDLGAGVGWLSHRAAQLGHRPLAVDLSVDELDGLGAAARHLSGGWPVVQAEFDRLPLADAQADVTVFNASLHYSVDLVATLSEALRVTRPDGAVVVMDSPIYRADAAGAAMVAERAADFERRFGTRSDAVPSVGYLTDAGIAALGQQLGVRWQTVVPWYGWRWAARPWRARLRRQRERSRFAVLVARRA
jgi:SAM-dependent methyltransferase